MNLKKTKAEVTDIKVIGSKVTAKKKLMDCAGHVDHFQVGWLQVFFFLNFYAFLLDLKETIAR